MRLLLASIALAALFAAGPALAAGEMQFDLQCELNYVDSRSPGKVAHASPHFSIDLTTGRWCSRIDNCAGLEIVGPVGPGTIRLIDSHDADGDFVADIERQGWRWTSKMTMRRPYVAETAAEGVCAVLPFTPFPAKGG